MDEGRLTDTLGRTVDFKNTIIIMTSNIGTRQLKDFGKGIGFTSGYAENMKEHSRSIITKALNKQFAPEFLNRLDEIINFDQLEMENLVKIVDIELEGLYKRVESIGYKLILDDEAKRFIANKGYDVQYGARPLKRAIQTYVEDPLSEVILGGEIKEGNTIVAVYDKETDNITMSIEK
jgi:ATP-dependent Clp protease ATP-binding subunit ClpC